MAVRSENLRNGERTSVVSAADLAVYQPAAMRAVAALLAIVSVVGNILAIDGQPALDSEMLTAAALGLGWQVVCSALQYIFCSRPLHPLYVLPLVGSVLPSVLGYWPLVVPALVPLVGLPGAAAVLIISLALVDIVPERTFIERGGTE